MENPSKRRKSIFQASAKGSSRDPLTDVQPKRPAEAPAEPEPAPKVVKEVVNVNGFVFKRKVDPAAASARTEDAAEPAPAPAEERQDSQASTQNETRSQQEAVPQYPTGERPTNLHELVSSSLSAEERLQTLCEHVVNAETEKLEAAFQGEYSFIAEAGVEALKEFQLQVEQASIQGEIRCGSAPVPGLAEKKERLRAMLRQYQEYEQKWNDELSAERARLAALQSDDAATAEAAAAAAAEAVAGTSAGLVMAEVAGCGEKLEMQSAVLGAMVQKINAMIDMAESSCKYFSAELHRQDMSTLPHVHSPGSAVREVARALV